MKQGYEWIITYTPLLFFPHLPSAAFRHACLLQTFPDKIFVDENDGNRVMRLKNFTPPCDQVLPDKGFVSVSKTKLPVVG
jgi:hypothetical protein